MTSLLTQLSQLSPFLAAARRGLFSDVDGTLSPIVPNPDEAQVSSRLRHLLSKISRHVDMAVISGRRAEQARQIVGLPNLVYVGNHGWESWENGQLHLRDEARLYLAQITAASGEIRSHLSLDGVILENKGVTATIHYRRCPKEAHPREAILTAVAASPSAQGLRLREGKKIIDLLPPLERNKGTALGELLERFKPEAALYLGDDVTDVDAFRALHRWRKEEALWAAAIAVVGLETPSLVMAEADYTLTGVAEVEQFLEWLANALG